MKWLHFAWKNVLRNRRRALITIVLATIGTAAVLLASGFALATYAALKENSARQIGHVVIAHHDYFDNDEETPLGHGLTDAQNLRTTLRQDPRIAAALPRINYSGLISNGEKSAIFIGTGIDVAGELGVDANALKVEQGRALAERTAVDALPEVMVAKDLARNLKVHPGDVLTLLSTTSDGALNGIDVQVAGIYATGTPEMDERAITTNLDSAQLLLRSSKVSTLSLYLKNLDEAPFIKEQLAQRYPELALRTWNDLADFYTKVHDLYDRIFGVLGIIIVLMVFFAVGNTMSMSITERTREIGTLAALGTARWRIVTNFTMESGIIGLLGGALGALLAGTVAQLVRTFPVMMPPPPGQTEGYPLLFDVTLPLNIKVMSVIFVLAVVAALIAAQRGVKKPIVEALQHV
ncbi:MAG TPA: FtsX-like permease family protein [Gammaproteobacteria bacterium]